MRSHSYGLGLSATPRTVRRREHSTEPKPIRKADGSLEYPKAPPTEEEKRADAARSYAAFFESRERLRERGIL